MTNEMKLEIAKLRADGYTVDVTVNYNTDKWDEYIEEYKAWSIDMAWCGGSAITPKHPSTFYTTEFKVTKDD